MTSSSTRSSRDSRPAVRAESSGLTVAVEAVRAVDDSRSRISGRAPMLRRPKSDTTLAALYVLGVGVWLAVTPPSGVRIGVLVACVAALAIASSGQ